MNKPISGSKPKLVRTLLTVAALAVAAFLLLFAGDVKISLDETSFTASAFLAGSTTVAYDAVTSIELAREFDKGSRSLGIGSFKISAGTFNNSLYGSYKLYSYNSCDSYVIIKYAGGTLVFNRAGEAETLSLYETLREKTGL